MVGAVFTGLMLAVTSYFFTMKDHSGGFLPLSDWWFLVVIVALVFGAIIGGISGATIAGFNLGLIKALIFGAIINCVILFVFYIFTNGEMSFGIKSSLLSLIPIGLVNSAIVSWLSSTSQELK